jgi:ferredoxin-NADP reductase
MPSPITEKSRTLVELPMAIFIRIAAGNGKMTAREMERFDKLLVHRDWCRSDLLRRSLAHTQSEKVELWKSYVAGELRAETEHVAAALDTVLGAVSSGERSEIEGDLVTLARQLLRATNGPFGFLRGDSDAKREFAAFMELLRRPSVRTQLAAAEVNTRGPADVAHQIPARQDFAPLLTSELDGEKVWRPGKLPVRCIQITDETHDVKTFRFCAEPPKLLLFRPGQFMTFEVPLDGKAVRRSYTISSSPSRPHTFSVTVKRQKNGLVSNWLHDKLRVGDMLFVDGPHGQFTCLGDPASSYLLLSGGSGITPLMSMSRWLCDTAAPVDLHFVHFARSSADLIFEHELALLGRQPGFRCDFVCSRAEPASGWTGRVGRIEPPLLLELCPDLRQRSVYLCGPVPFMEAARTMLEGMSFDMARFHQESFGGVPRAALAPSQAKIAARVEFSASKKSIRCHNADYVLDLALAAGVPAAFSCRAGQCGTCKVVLLRGEVEQDSTDALSPDDIKEGLILSCQARPRGDIAVDL